MVASFSRNMVVKLTYFQIPGRGEPIRMLLSAMKIEFEDRRVTMEEWAKLKPTLKWPHLPILEMDGKTLFQSMSISRYLARKGGLYGSSEDESLAIDTMVYAIDDMRRKVTDFYYLRDSKERDEDLKNASEVIVPLYMKNIEEQLAENNGYLIAGKLTWADINFITYTSYISYLLGHDILTDFPRLKEHEIKISELPGIKEYLDKRPPFPKDMRAVFGQ